MTESKFKIPHTLVILFSMVVLAQILTYVIPAGSFDRVENAAGRLQVVPGTFHLTPAAAEQRMIDYAPLKRIASTTEISHAVLYLASYEARFITGASLPIDGGTTAWR